MENRTVVRDSPTRPDERPEAAAGPDGLKPGSTNDAWPAELTRRLRVLLHTLPLDGLRRADSMRDEDLRHYDSLALALRVLDLVIDRLGLEQEADREVITRALAPILTASDVLAGLDPSSVRQDRIVDKLLSGLRNDSCARRPFREEYTSIGPTGDASRHVVEFRLLYDAFHPSGRTVLKPSNEACNLYLRLLDLDVEDAQAAAEAVVESQLARGRFDEAVHSARQARIQSVRFREKVSRVLRDTRRDVDRVDWRGEVPAMLDGALAHLERRLTVERGILGVANERLEVMPDEDATGRQAVAQVGDLTRDCLLRHTELHETLIGARNVFLDAQARQSFSPGPSRPLPNLPEDVLVSLLGLPVRDAAPVTDRAFPIFIGARAPVRPSLVSLVTGLLQPRRPAPRREIPVEAVDPTDLEFELRRYPPEVRAAALSYIHRPEIPTHLSCLLATARADDAPEEVLEVMVLLALQAFATEDRANTGVSADLVSGVLLADSTFYGNDLLLQPAGEHSDVAA
jgi:hypothetical protein